MHPAANRQRYPAEARGSQDHRGGYKDVVYEATSAQAQDSQALSSMSVQRGGYEHGGYQDAGHGPPSTQAQGKSGKGDGYGYGADIHKPSPTEVKEHQSHVSSTGYGTGYERQSSYRDPVRKTPPREEKGNKSRVSSTGYSTGYDHSLYKDPVQKSPPTEIINTQCRSSTGYSIAYGTGHDQDGGYKDPVQKPPTEEGGVHKAPLNQPPVAAHDRTNVARPLGPRNGHYQVSGHEDPSPAPAVPFHVNVQLYQDGTAPTPPKSSGCRCSIL